MATRSDAKTHRHGSFSSIFGGSLLLLAFCFAILVVVAIGRGATSDFAVAALTLTVAQAVYVGALLRTTVRSLRLDADGIEVVTYGGSRLRAPWDAVEGFYERGIATVGARRKTGLKLDRRRVTFSDALDEYQDAVDKIRSRVAAGVDAKPALWERIL